MAASIYCTVKGASCHYYWWIPLTVGNFFVFLWSARSVWLHSVVRTMSGSSSCTFQDGCLHRKRCYNLFSRFIESFSDSSDQELRSFKENKSEFNDKMVHWICSSSLFLSQLCYNICPVDTIWMPWRWTTPPLQVVAIVTNSLFTLLFYSINDARSIENWSIDQTWIEHEITCSIPSAYKAAQWNSPYAISSASDSVT